MVPRLHGKRCPHCDCDYNEYVKQIRERHIPAKKDGEYVILNEIEKYCKHCETKWIVSIDVTLGFDWENCHKKCDCLVSNGHAENCASHKLT